MSKVTLNSNKPSVSLKKPKTPSLSGGGVTLAGGPKVKATAGAGEAAADQTTEEMAAEETSELLQGFKDRAKREQQRFVQATDSEFWFAICFQTREQKEEFLHKWLGSLDLGDKYLDGMQVAELLGILLESEVPPMPKLRTDSKLAAMARDL